MVKRAKPKKKKDPGKLTDKQTRSIVGASRIVIASTLIYFRQEHGWGAKRVDRLMDAYNREVEEYAATFQKAFGCGIVIEVASPNAKGSTQKLVDRKIRSGARDRYMRMADEFIICMMLRAVKNVTGWGSKRLGEWLEAVESLSDEIANPWQSTTPDDIYKWCKEVCEVNVMQEVIV